MFKIWFSNEPEPPAPQGAPARRGALVFGDDVREALARTRDAAISLGHGQVTTTHQVLGIVADARCEGARALAAAGVDADELRRRLTSATAADPRVVTPGTELPYTGGAKRALELAMEEAHRTGAEIVTSRHLLAGIVRQGKEAAARALGELGFTLESLRAMESAAAAAFGIRIDDASDRSIYEQIVAQVREAAATGRAAPGQRLPSVRALADELDIAPGTVARAYAELERQGVVVTDGARGTRIAERPAGEPARVDDLAGLIRPAVVAAYHQGARAADLRAALERAMAGIYPPEDDPPAAPGPR
ncbi:MAG TPA: Clp protease N-terminal domain-containing protein [Longimicrobium sp.]